MNEKENTARILKEQPLLVTNFFCRFGWHSWTKWNEPKKDIGYDPIQLRTCVHCNAYDIRKVKTPL